jgi:hypothetical protein
VAEEPSRQGLIDSFRLIASTLDEIVALARTNATEDSVLAAHPRIKREAHRRRIMGTLRWMIASDTLVERASSMPQGFACLTTEADHNQGRYAFAFPGRPGGVFMVRRKPHDPGEGEYVQNRLDGVLEYAPLAEAFKQSPLKVYVSIPPKGEARLIGEHRAWDQPLWIPLSEVRSSASVPITQHTGRNSTRPASKPPRPIVRSTKRTIDEQTSVHPADDV